MNRSPKIPLTVSGNIFRTIGLVFYFVGAIVAVLIVSSAHKIGQLKRAHDFWGAVVAVIVGGLLAYGVVRLGHTLYFYGKRLCAKQKTLTMVEMLSHDGPSPVLYLRSFVDDGVTSETPIAYNLRGVQLPRLSTEEEHLARAIGDIGPFITFANPHEPLPRLGATRVPAEWDWRSTVTKLMSRSQLVMFRVGFGDHLWWEIEESLKLINHQRVVFLIPNDDRTFHYFRRRLQPMLSHEIPDLAREMNIASTIGSILYFDSADVPRLSPMTEPGVRADPMQPLLPMLRMALKPVFEQLGLKWTPPPIPQRRNAGVVICGGSALWLIYWPYELTSVRYESFFSFETILLLPILHILVTLGALSFLGGLVLIDSASKEFRHK
jgi:hypothetical protein